jgi:hypothetical protein
MTAFCWSQAKVVHLSAYLCLYMTRAINSFEPFSSVAM